MNKYAALVRHCLNAYDSIRQTDWEFTATLGDDVGLLSRPVELSKALKARLIGFRAAAGINFLALAILILEAKAHA
jgi:hypothetical protein